MRRVRHMTERLVDFLIIGAMKCGTTTLQAQLASQPGIFMTTPKEPNFFSDDEVFARGIEWYRSLFAQAMNGHLKGEASTHYTKLPTYPHTVERMKSMLERPKFIYVIRNPVARAVSHHIHEWSEGRAPKDISAAFNADKTFESYGRYPMQIKPFISAFGLEQIHLTSLELLKADPEGELTKIAAHLERPGEFHWKHQLDAQNMSAKRVRRLPFQNVIVDNSVATALRRALVPKAVRNWIRARRTITERPELPGSLQHYLQDVFAPDRGEMENLFPNHPALPLAYHFEDE